VFDWDGTLMDSEARIVNCLQAAFGDLGLPPPAREAARDVIGLGLDEAILRLHPGGGSADPPGLVTGYRRYFLEIDPTPSVLFAGARETLSRLSERRLPLAVATGKGRVGLDKALAETGLGALFHATRCADETFSKPDPQMLLELMDELGAECRRDPDDRRHRIRHADGRERPHQGTRRLLRCPCPVERLMPHAPLDCLDELSMLPEWLTRRAADRG
jgi:phosphoglycolate phosphatase